MCPSRPYGGAQSGLLAVDDLTALVFTLQPGVSPSIILSFINGV